MEVDSEAVFRWRLAQLKLDGLYEKFKAVGWTTHGAFAYSSAYTPGSQTDSMFATEVVEVVLGSPAIH